MASLGNPRSWVPYMNNKDCSQGFCSLYCPQWCYIVYPPPPPFEFPEENSGPNFSPLVIAVIGVLASALLLVSYYTIISRYCGNPDSSDTQNHHDPSNHELQHFHDPSLLEPWQASPAGLDEALIRSITVFKYKKEDGLVTVADCSVCLSEFKDDERIRLLPKCSHAFHIPCIDTWLKSHSSCPLCRSRIFTFNASAVLMASDNPTMENSTFQENENNNEVVGLAVEEEESEETRQRGTAPKPTLRAMSDLGNLQGRHHSVIEIKDEEYVEPFRRSVSMDHSFQSGNRVVVVVEEEEEEAGSSKRCRGESSKSNSRRRVLQCVLSPIIMKRSFSSGRFSIRRGRQQGIIPI